MRIYQTALRCYLETIEENIVHVKRPVPLTDQLIRRQDLGFIGNADYDNLTFDPRKSVLDNARMFIEHFDSYSTVMTCSELFTDEGARRIEDEYFASRRDG